MGPYRQLFPRGHSGVTRATPAMVSPRTLAVRLWKSGLGDASLTLVPSRARGRQQGARTAGRAQALTRVADAEALPAGRVVRGPAQEQLVAPAREVGRFRVVPT